MNVIYFNSAREMKRAIEREKMKERMAFQKKIEKQLEKKVLVETNEAFTKIQSDLVKLGWLYEDGFLNYVELPDSESITDSPAVRLVNEKFNATLIPHDEGIEISRLEVWEQYQGQGYASLFLDNILRFLVNKGIDDIFVLPLPAGIGKSRNSLAYNTDALQGFYQKRGFQKVQNSFYWKLISKNAIHINKLDLKILTKKIV